MKPHERQQIIDDKIRLEGEVKVESLALEFKVSTETIRRDLSELVEAGRAQKTHGGARRPRIMASEGSFDERLATETQAKLRIGRLLSNIVTPGEVLFIDTGSTTLACAEYLAAIPDLTIVTNSTILAEKMAANDSAEIYLLGGRFVGGNAQTTGPEAISQIGKYHADRTIITVAAFSPANGGWDANYEEALVARAMIASSDSLTVLADSTKFDKKAPFRACEVAEIDHLICDPRVKAGEVSKLKGQGVAVWQ